MDIKEDKIDSLAKRYDMEHIEVWSVLFKAIAIIYNCNGAVIIDSNIYIASFRDNHSIDIKKVNPNKRAIYNILKEFIRQLDIKSVENNFYRFFKKDIIYKVRPLYFTDNRIYLEVLDNNRAKLYNFFIPIRELCFAQVNNIRNNIFFTEENIFFVNIIKRINKNIVMCGMLNPSFLKKFFWMNFKLLLKKFEKKYYITELKVKIDIYSKDVIFYCRFHKNAKASFEFIGVLERILSKSIGKVKIYLLNHKKAKYEEDR